MLMMRRCLLHIRMYLCCLFSLRLSPDSLMPSFKLHVFIICHSLCCSLLCRCVSLAPTVAHHIDMRIPAFPGEECNLIIIKQLAGEAVCV